MTVTTVLATHKGLTTTRLVEHKVLFASGGFDVEYAVQYLYSEGVWRACLRRDGRTYFAAHELSKAKAFAKRQAYN